MCAKNISLDQLTKKLKEMEKAANSMDGKHSVPFSELFHPSFMSSHTRFQSIDEFVEASSFDFSDMESIDGNELDSFVKNNTDFKSWDEMKTSAATEWTAKKLGF